MAIYLYFMLAYLVGFLLFLLFRKQEGKPQFLILFYRQTVKKMAWIVPTSAVAFGLLFLYNGFRTGDAMLMVFARPISALMFGALLGALLGLAISFGIVIVRPHEVS
jgi:hypothetical protein